MAGARLADQRHVQYLSIFRTFPIKERVRIQFRAEAYNWTNTPHFNNPGTNASNMRLAADGSIAALGNFMSSSPCA